jgi:hypothetical protein
MSTTPTVTVRYVGPVVDGVDLVGYGHVAQGGTIAVPVDVAGTPNTGTPGKVRGDDAYRPGTGLLASRHWQAVGDDAPGDVDAVLASAASEPDLAGTLDRFTVPELEQAARRRGLALSSTARKGDVIAALVDDVAPDDDAAGDVTPTDHEES